MIPPTPIQMRLLVVEQRSATTNQRAVCAFVLGAADVRLGLRLRFVGATLVELIGSQRSGRQLHRRPVADGRRRLLKRLQKKKMREQKKNPIKFGFGK